MDDTTRLDSVGSVKISEDVVAGIAGVAARDVSGVSALHPRIELRGISGIMGRRGTSKGVRIEMTDAGAVVELVIVVDYGNRVDEVAAGVQKSVKRAIETMAGVRVAAVNVHVQGVHIPQKIIKEE